MAKIIKNETIGCLQSFEGFYDSIWEPDMTDEETAKFMEFFQLCQKASSDGEELPDLPDDMACRIDRLCARQLLRGWREYENIRKIGMLNYKKQKT